MYSWVAFSIFTFHLSLYPFLLLFQPTVDGCWWRCVYGDGSWFLLLSLSPCVFFSLKCVIMEIIFFLFYCLKTYKQVIALKNFNFIISTMNLNEWIRNDYGLTRQIQQIPMGYDSTGAYKHKFGTFDAIEISIEWNSSFVESCWKTWMDSLARPPAHPSSTCQLNGWNIHFKFLKIEDIHS